MKNNKIKINESTLRKLIKESIDTETLKQQLQEKFEEQLLELYEKVVNDHGYDLGLCEDYCDEYAYYTSDKLANDCIKVVNSNNWNVPQNNFRTFDFVMENDYNITTKEELLEREDACDIIIDWFWDCFGSWGLKYNFGSDLDEFMNEMEDDEDNDDTLNESKVKNLIKKNIKKVLNEAGHLYWKDEDGVAHTNSKETYRGVPGTTYISHGEWSDPEVWYDGCELNVNDIEDSLWYSYKDKCEEKEENPTEQGFEEWLNEMGTDYIKSELDDLVWAKNGCQ